MIGPAEGKVGHSERHCCAFTGFEVFDKLASLALAAESA